MLGPGVRARGVGRSFSVNCKLTPKFRSNVDPMSVKCWSSFGQVSTKYGENVGKFISNCSVFGRRIGREPTNKLSFSVQKPLDHLSRNGSFTH